MENLERPAWGNRFMLLFLGWNLTCQIVLAAEMSLAPGLWFLRMPYYYLIFYIVVFFMPAAVYLLFTGQRPGRALRLRRISAKNGLFVVALALLAVPYNSLLSLLSSIIFPNASQAIMDSVGGLPLWVQFVVICLCPPFFEEIVFRGVIGANYRRVGMGKAALVTGLFFGIMHLDGQQLLYAWAMGALFYAVYRVTGSLLASMLAHFTTNAFSFCLNLAIGGGQARTAVTYGWQEYAGAALVYTVAALATFPLLRLMWRRFRAANPPADEESPAKTAVFTPSFWLILGIYAIVFALQAAQSVFPHA